VHTYLLDRLKDNKITLSINTQPEQLQARIRTVIVSRDATVAQTLNRIVPDDGEKRVALGMSPDLPSSSYCLKARLPCHRALPNLTFGGLEHVLACRPPPCFFLVDVSGCHGAGPEPL
jgi:hypothetical protein